MHSYQQQPQQDDKSPLHKPESSTSARPMVGSKAARQAAVLQMQRTHGNQAVQRFVIPDVFGPAGGGGGGATTPDSGGGGAAADTASPSSISGTGGSISVDGGGIAIESTGPLTISAPGINNSTAMNMNSGIVQGNTLMAENVVASNYTPGAGNLY